MRKEAGTGGSLKESYERLRESASATVGLVVQGGKERGGGRWTLWMATCKASAACSHVNNKQEKRCVLASFRCSQKRAADKRPGPGAWAQSAAIFRVPRYLGAPCPGPYPLLGARALSIIQPPDPEDSRTYYRSTGSQAQKVKGIDYLPIFQLAAFRIALVQ